MITASALEALNAIMADLRPAIAAVEDRILLEIAGFKSATDDKGNLLHPHFEELEDAMALLVEAAVAAREPAPPLEELYDTALQANRWALQMATAATRH
jgi:hypothetical protein